MATPIINAGQYRERSQQNTKETMTLLAPPNGRESQGKGFFEVAPEYIYDRYHTRPLGIVDMRQHAPQRDRRLE
jgi:hypothetical protein